MIVEIKSHIQLNMDDLEVSGLSVGAGCFVVSLSLITTTEQVFDHLIFPCSCSCSLTGIAGSPVTLIG